MAFQTPRSIQEMMTAIHTREYLMPAIQREFVWSTGQIIRLFDSLMRGYPVGSFLLWDVKPETAQSYTFYEFLTNYHERDNPYAGKATVPSGSGTTAVLDGQQRLTSLNIALPDGIDDAMYCHVFKHALERIVATYRPEAVVLQCGGDSVAGDRDELASATDQVPTTDFF